MLSRAEVLTALRGQLGGAPYFGATLSELVSLEAWGELASVLAAYERQKVEAPWLVGPVLRYLTAHPGKEAKHAHARIEAAQLGGKGTPAKGSK